MLVYRTIEKKVFWQFDSIIMQNMSHNLLLFCAPTWPSRHASENHLWLCTLWTCIFSFLSIVWPSSANHQRENDQIWGFRKNVSAWAPFILVSFLRVCHTFVSLKCLEWSHLTTTLSLPLPSSLPKLPIISKHRHCASIGTFSTYIIHYIYGGPQGTCYK